MSRFTKLLLAGLVISLMGCEARTDRVDGGGVLLSVSDFDELPIQVGVNAAVAGGGFVQIGELTVQNVPKDPTGVTSDLMNVEIRSYEIVFTRGDTGTRLPPPLVRGLFGVAPVGGTFDVENLPIMTIEQLGNPPLSDLLFENGGFDKETGSSLIVLNFRLRFFGRTLSGDEVESAPSEFTINFVP